MYLAVGRGRIRGLVGCSINSIFWYLIQIPRRNREKSPEVILELVPMGVGEIISERIKGEKYSCEGLWVSIPDRISEKESSGKTFSILLPDLIKKFSLDLEF